MSEDSVDDLISQLNSLELSQRELDRKRENLTSRLVRARAQERGAARESASERTGVERFRVGDRVRITNEIRSSFLGRRPTPADRRAVVIRITEKRVHFRTDSGITTSRAPNNLAFE